MSTSRVPDRTNTGHENVGTQSPNPMRQAGLKFTWPWLSLMGIAILNGCGDGLPPPQPTIVGCKEFGVIGVPLVASASFAEASNINGIDFHWRVSQDSVLVLTANEAKIEFTPTLPGEHFIELVCSKNSQESSASIVKVVVETAQQRDSRLTKGMVGQWRYSTEEAVYFLQLHADGTLNLRGQVLAGGMGDAIVTMAQNDMGLIKGEWWVTDGDLVVRASGVQNPVWNVWLRFIDSVTNGEFGKVQRCETTFEGDSMTLKGDFTEGVARVLSRIVEQE